MMGVKFIWEMLCFHYGLNKDLYSENEKENVCLLLPSINGCITMLIEVDHKLIENCKLQDGIGSDYRTLFTNILEQLIILYLSNMYADVEGTTYSISEDHKTVKYYIDFTIYGYDSENERFYLKPIEYDFSDDDFFDDEESSEDIPDDL